MKKKKIGKEILQELYEKKKFNTYQIADKFNCCQATIWKRLIEFGIKRRTPYELNSNVPQKEKLIELYKDKKLSTWQIEKKYGYSRGTIHRKLKEYGIKTRDRADSHIVFPRKDFSGDLIEKAYLIGFRLGDLGVRKIYPNSKTICIASGSTIPEQIKLIKNLFKGYGKVWIQKTKDNKINIQTNLNNSFEFLLSKEMPRWISKNKECFFAFLAGFTDAEGSFCISRDMAYYSLGNCDFQLLTKIKDNLNKFGIKIERLYLNKRKGKPTTEGYFFNSDYYQLRIGNKEKLLALLLNLKPHIKHKNKIEALKKAENNIIERNNRRLKI